MYLQPVIPFVNCLQFEAVSFFEPEVYRFSDESLSAYAKCAFDDIYRNQKISRIFFSSKYIYLNQKVSTTASVFVSYTDARGRDHCTDAQGFSWEVPKQGNPLQGRPTVQLIH